jgi:hypothetical protein
MKAEDTPTTTTNTPTMQYATTQWGNNRLHTQSQDSLLLLMTFDTQKYL